MMKILLAGSTGYLGGYIGQELQKRSCFFRVIVRNPKTPNPNLVKANEVITAELTSPDSIRGCCRDIDVVISTVGITRQKDGLTYMDVDYQANMNLLAEAQARGVKKFIYVSVLNGKELDHLKICEAKELFAAQLEKSGMDYCIIRPNGFFSDMAEFLTMAKKGRIYLFGNGNLKTNPIHGEDLAIACVDAIDTTDRELEIGGPETLTHHEIASIAFEVAGNKPKITFIPEWLRVATLSVLRLATKSTVYGPVEFFMTVMAMDMVAPEYGKQTLQHYFTTLRDSD